MLMTSCSSILLFFLAPQFWFFSCQTLFTFSIDASAEQGALRHLGKDKPGPPKGHPNKSDHEPKTNRCPVQVFPACENGGAFGTDTCIACCECECDDAGTTVEEAKAKCEFEGEEDALDADKRNCTSYGMFDYDGVDDTCTSTCAAVCTV